MEDEWNADECYGCNIGEVEEELKECDGCGQLCCDSCLGENCGCTD